MKSLTTLAISAALAGCASSPGGLQQPQNASSFAVAQPYQLTLKRIVEADEECRPTQLLPLGQAINDVQNYPDLREARIVHGASGVGTQIYQVITIKEDGDQSVVTLYAKAQQEKILARLERWAGGSRDCRL